MIYATYGKMLEMYGQDFIDDILPTDVDDKQVSIEDALAQASAQVDAYLSARYALPLAQKPMALERPAIDIAAYIVANRDSRLTKTLEDRQKDAIAFLKDISAGKAGLGEAEPKVSSTGGNSDTSGSFFDARPPRFGPRA